MSNPPQIPTGNGQFLPVKKGPPAWVEELRERDSLIKSEFGHTSVFAQHYVFNGSMVIVAWDQRSQKTIVFSKKGKAVWDNSTDPFAPESPDAEEALDDPSVDDDYMNAVDNHEKNIVPMIEDFALKNGLL